MKRALISLLILAVFCLPGVLGCGQASSDAAPGDGSGGDAMLGLLPMNATGVFFVDLQRAMNIPAAQEALAESNQELNKFMAETGIDPAKDVFSLAGAVTSPAGGDATEGVLVLNVKFDKDVLVAKLKESEKEITEETYEGVTIYSSTESESGEETQIAFLDNSLVVVGTPDDVRAVIDVHQKRADSILKNTNLMKTVESTKRDGLFWAAFTFSEGDMQSLSASNPMLGQLGGVQSMVMSVDYKEQNILGEIECRSASPEQNQQIVDMLNGFKSFAAMGAAENPEMAEMLRRIEITSGPDNVRISAVIPEALLKEMEKNEY